MVFLLFWVLNSGRCAAFEWINEMLEKWQTEKNFQRYFLVVICVLKNLPFSFKNQGECRRRRHHRQPTKLGRFVWVCLRLCDAQEWLTESTVEKWIENATQQELYCTLYTYYYFNTNNMNWKCTQLRLQANYEHKSLQLRHILNGGSNSTTQHKKWNGSAWRKDK